MSSLPPLLAALNNLPAELVVAVAALTVAAFVGGGVGVWRVYGTGPRRHRVYKHVRELLHKGDWKGAKAGIDELRTLGTNAPEWAGRITNLEGEALRAAGDAALAERNFEEALEHHVAAAKLLGTSDNEARGRVIEGMLAELRQRFAAGADEKAVKLAQRVLQLQSPCPEAAFWLGLLGIRQNRPEQAQQMLRVAAEGADKRNVDAPLYLGMLLVREGKPKEGLRYLGEANKAAPNSPLVGWQLGTGLLASGGDPALATRALQKATGPDGLAKFTANPQTFWKDVLPEESYVGRLSAQAEYVCPILGGNIAGMARQAKLALGQAYFRQDRAIEAVGVFRELVNESEPSPGVLRSLGIALAKLEHFDDAYAHLKSAYEQETTKNPLTACHLAYCAARAKPNREEDRPANVRWAVRLLIDLPIPVEPEPARMVAFVFGEARKLGIAIPAEDMLRLCNTLLALNAIDATAAGAIEQLAATMPEAVRPPHAFLYGQAALQGFRGERDVELLATLFRNEAAARLFYQERGWDLAAVERLFLDRWAESHTGFPDAFGPDYPARCEKELLERAKQQDAASDPDGAKATIDLLRRLIPPSAANLDQLAKLAWHRGELDEAVRLLTEWANQFPDLPTPRLRLAMVEQQRGNGDATSQQIRAAMERSTGTDRAKIAFIGAKLALKGIRPDEAVTLLDECLRDNPQHPDALWLRTALRWHAGGRAALATFAGAMPADSADPRLAFLAAVCQAEAGDLDGARESARRVAAAQGWQADGHHLLGVILARRGEWPAAAERFEAAAQAGDGPLADHAKALLGRAKIEQQAFVESARLWHSLSPEKRQAWDINAALPGLTFLAGVQALRAGDAQAAAEWLTCARELKVNDPRLGTLQERAVIQAARQLFDGDPKANFDSVLPLLDRASKSRSPQQLLAALLLSRIHRRHNRIPEAREALRRPGAMPVPVLLELGVVSAMDRQLSQAEEVFARVRQLEPDNPTANVNLFWARLSLGNPAGAQELLPGLIEHTADAEQRNLFQYFQALLKGGQVAPAFAGMTAEEEQRTIAALFGIARLEVAVPLLCLFAPARPQSKEAREAQTLGMLRLGKQRFDRGDWLGAERWLSPLAKARPTAAVRNLLGLVACLTQDFNTGILHLQEAQRLAGDDPRIHQNLAIAFSWQGDFTEADLCWGRYLGTMGTKLPRPPGYFDYHERLRFQVLKHLGNQHYEGERWTHALAYIEEAHRMRPENLDLTERLFLLQVQAGQRDEARKTLNELRHQKPKNPTYELYELDLIEIRSSEDLEQLLDVLGRVVDTYPDDKTAQEKAVVRTIPALQHRADQLTKAMRDIREDLRRLFEDSPGWYDALRDLRAVKRDLRRLRQVTRYCASLPVGDAHRRRLDTLTEELERKIEYCRRWEED
ncbi:MAG: tetratricopeptide repeat protein [Gemmataceae bacterium]